MERRVEKLQGEYRRPQAVLDRRYHGVQDDQVEPLQRRLDSYGPLVGLVCGWCLPGR